MMTNKQMDNRLKKLEELEARMKELEKQIEAVKDEMKAEMQEKQEEEYDTGKYIIRYQVISQKRLDNTALKTDLPDVYAKYSKDSSYRKFTYKAS